MLRQAHITIVTITALMPLLVAIAIAASVPSLTLSDHATDAKPTWTIVRYASKATP